MTKFNGFHDWRKGVYTGFQACLDCKDRFPACQDVCEIIQPVKEKRDLIRKQQQIDSEQRRCRNKKQFP